MDGQQYPSRMPPLLGGFYPSGYPPVMPPPETLQQSGMHQMRTMSMDHLGSYAPYEDPIPNALPPPSAPPRSRRRQPPGAEHVKHRRTRSGCYTCRQRRVKCDETHPICERCRKGKRECAYPGASSSTSKPSKSRSKGSPGGGSSPSGSDDIDDDEPLSALPDNDEDEVVVVGGGGDEPHPTPTSTTHRRSVTAWFGSPHHSESASPGPRARRQSEDALSRPGSTCRLELSRSPRWSSLPKDVKFYLKYHRDSLTHHHYGFKFDGGNFLQSTFLEIALNDSSAALLYAIVAFTAYHHTIGRDNKRISEFLFYYNKSIACLQQSLKSRRHNVATLLTILQLATIEEFLGDWVNLLGHQKAAYQLLTDLFTPQTIMQDETRRKIITWYLRFDLFAGMLAGGETTLDREWFAASADFYKRQTRDRPNDLGARFEEYFATSRLLATDVALLFAARGKNAISDEQFASGTEALTTSLREFGRKIEGAFIEPSCFVKTFPRAPPSPSPPPPPDGDDLFDSQDPNFLYAAEYSPMNFVLLDHWAIDLMFKYQLSLAVGRPPSPDFTEIARKKCKMFEAIQYGEASPAAILGCQASLGIQCLFLPKEERYTTWARRKFACIEQLGYIYPATLRTRMSELWGEDVTDWWLPNNEGYPIAIKTLRDFIAYRASKPGDDWSTGVREMSGIFRNLDVNEHGALSDGGPLRSPKSGSTDSNGCPWKHESSPESQSLLDLIEIG